MLLSMALVLHVLETLLPPPLPLPGVKLGLANLMTVAAILLLGPVTGIALAIARSIVGGLLVGTFLSVGFFLSLGGALASAIVVAVALRWLRPILSLVGVSILGALTHNTMQLVLAWLFFIQQGALFYYLPILWLLALISGLLTGVILQAIERRGLLISVLR
jgi:heptaprenyl diphosphate synthase